MLQRVSIRRLFKSLQWFVNGLPAFHHAVRSVWVPPERIRRHLALRGDFKITIEPGASFRLLGFGATVENELFWRGYAGTWEKRSLEYWRELVKSSDYILDVGANTGIYALAAHALNPKSKVLAVEPVPRVHARLRQNIELNGFPILSAEVAASDRDGVATFYDHEGEHEYCASLDPGMGGSTTTTVPVATLDSLLERFEFPRIDLIKMDIERHEPAALRGMRKALERDRPILLIEVLDDECRRGVELALEGLDYLWSPPFDTFNYLLTPQPAEQRGDRRQGSVP